MRLSAPNFSQGRYWDHQPSTKVGPIYLLFEFIPQIHLLLIIIWTIHSQEQLSKAILHILKQTWNGVSPRELPSPHTPPPTKKYTARNHACSDFYHFCLLNAHQITSPFMHIISNYILGVSGGNGIQEALRIAISPFLSLRLFSFLLFLNGVWLYLLFLVFPFLGCLIIVLWFLDVFASFVHFLCTGLCFFNKLLNYLSKTKTKNYIPLPRVIHPSYISRDDFDFIDTIEEALPFTDFLASYQPQSSFLFYFLINNGIVLKRSLGTPGVNMENSTSNT